MHSSDSNVPRLGRILVTHLGFQNLTTKKFIVKGTETYEFEIQNIIIRGRSTGSIRLCLAIRHHGRHHFVEEFRLDFYFIFGFS